MAKNNESFSVYLIRQWHHTDKHNTCNMRHYPNGESRDMLFFKVKCMKTVWVIFDGVLFEIAQVVMSEQEDHDGPGSLT